MGKKRKYKPRQVGPDEDLLHVFTRKKSEPVTSDSEPAAPEHHRHGLPVVDGQFSASCSKTSGTPPNTTEKEFAALLESYLSRPSRKKSSPPKPMPYHRRIKRYPPPEKDLDLHGFTALGAQLKARSFLTACRHQGYFTVRIIVGKGLHSDPGPVLPDTIEDLLTQLKQQDVVLGFAWEQKKKVRSGAVIVYLRQFDD
jgi:DNA-nicking Smr family endonuclease